MGTISVENDHKKRNRSCKECYARWDKSIAGLVGVLAFLAIIAVLLYEIYNNTKTEPAPSYTNITIYERFSKTDFCSVYENSCKVVCNRNLATHDIDEIIKDAVASLSCRVDLEIIGLVPPGNKIPAKWLNNIGREIATLKISSSDKITQIEDGAFSSDYLKRLSKLVISNCNGITYFGKGMFKDMDTSLTEFMLEYYKLTPVIIEKGFLFHVTGLQLLQLTYCSLKSESIENITNSDVNLSKLTQIDLRYSQILSLEKSIFDRAPNLVALYLNNIALSSLELGIFRKHSKLSLITLQENSLTTLPEGIFDGISLTSNTKISVHGNPLLCDCALKWLQEMYVNGAYITKDPKPTCYNYEHISFEDVEFCLTSDSTTTASTTTDISTTSDISTTMREKYRTVTCKDNAKNGYSNSEKELFYTQILKIHEEIFHFSFYEANNIENVRIEVNINTTAELNYFHLLWFNSHNPDEEGCITNLRTDIILDDLQRNNTYTICILYNDDTKVSPHDCFGLRVRVEYSERAWIRNKTRNIFIILAMCLILTIIFISACLMYWCVRFNPKLIKGNNRVIIIGKQKPRPQSVLREYERPAYVAPSVDSYATAHASYMTTSDGYCKIKNRNKQFSLGSIREESIYNCDVSYVNPRSQNFNNWGQDIFIPRVTIQSEESSIYEPVPPPLPPPNQQQKEKSVLTEENLYTTV